MTARRRLPHRRGLTRSSSEILLRAEVRSFINDIA